MTLSNKPQTSPEEQTIKFLIYWIYTYTVLHHVHCNVYESFNKMIFHSVFQNLFTSV